jgi:hypothetical protein
MQPAAGIGKAAAVMTMPLAVIAAVLPVLIVAMQCKSVRCRYSTCALRRYNTSNLGSHEQADQQTDDPRYRAQPFQNTLNPFRPPEYRKPRDGTSMALVNISRTFRSRRGTRFPGAQRRVDCPRPIGHNRA